MKYTLLFPLFVFATLAVSAQGDTVMLSRGDVMLMSAGRERNITVGGKQKTFIAEQPKPLLLNGQEIFYYTDADNDTAAFMMKDGVPVRHNRADSMLTDTYIQAWKQVSQTVDSCMEMYEDHINDCIYSFAIYNIVADTTGRVVYFETEGIKGRAAPDALHNMPGQYDIPEPLSKLINLRLNTLLYVTRLPVMNIGGKTTPYCYTRYTTTISKGRDDADKPEYAKPRQPISN